MKYDDFPILNNEQYEAINTQFKKQNTINRKDLLTEICQNLSNCSTSCSMLFQEHNQHVRQALLKSNSTLNKLFNNLTSTFDINPIKTHVFNTNIFNLLNRLTNTISLIQQWSQTEEKIYYISIANKTTTDILNCINSILHSLENSNIKFFKHM